MPARHFILATAGHVDHGKSALVRALTGTDPDRLPEEKARGITIDLGFANLVLPAPDENGEFDLGLVDVPGHEDFIRNMVAGVGSIDVALLVVAADDGWMPQTEEHLQILLYLGVTRAVVALTKIDLTPTPHLAAEAVREHLRRTSLAGAPIVPTSITTGAGLDELRMALARVLAGAPAPRDIGKPRLPVDRVFTLRGIGTVATGTLTGGRLTREAPVVAQPSGRTAHVRNLQSHGRARENAEPGTRTAVNLPEFDATGDAALRRGDTLTLPGLGSPSATLDVLLTRLDRAGPVAPFRDGTHVRIHHGTAHRLARVRLLDSHSLELGAQAVARLRCEAPLFAFAGDRLVVRDGAGRTTLAGAVILDPEPGKRRFRGEPQRRFLPCAVAALAHCDLTSLVAAVLARDQAVAANTLLLRTNFSAGEIRLAADKLVSANLAARPAAGYVVDCSWWKTLRARAAGLIDAWHATHPEKPGLPLDRLRSGLRRELRFPELFPELFDALEDTLSASGFVRSAGFIRRAGHRPALPPNLRAAGERLRTALAAHGLEPPSVKELAPDTASIQALRFLRETGEVIEVSAELVLPVDSYRRVRAAIVRCLKSEGSATASELRQMLATTRRVMIPLLEHLDRAGVTRREGDRHVLRT